MDLVKFVSPCNSGTQRIHLKILERSVLGLEVCASVQGVLEFRGSMNTYLCSSSEAFNVGFVGTRAFIRHKSFKPNFQTPSPAPPRP